MYAVNSLFKVGGMVASVLDPMAAALSGAIDIVVVRHKDGTYHCTPFHVRFGKLQLMRSSEKIVKISVNGEETDLLMKLGPAGEAFFAQEVDDGPIPEELSTSPILPSPLDSTPTMRAEDTNTLMTPANVDVDILGQTEVANAIAKGHRRRTKSLEERDEYDYPFSDPEPEAQPAHTGRLGSGEEALSDGESGSRYEWQWGWGSLPTRSRNRSGADATAEAARMAAERTNGSGTPPDVATLPVVLDTSEAQLTTLLRSIPEVSSPVTSIPDISNPPPAPPPAPLRSEVEVSLCGHLLEGATALDERTRKIFQHHVIKYDDFCRNPALLYSSEAVYRIDDRLYTWQTALPYLACKQLFHAAPSPVHIHDALSCMNKSGDHSESPSPPSSPTRTASSPIRVLSPTQVSSSRLPTSPIPLASSPPPSGSVTTQAKRISSWRSWVPFLGEKKSTPSTPIAVATPVATSPPPPAKLLRKSLRPTSAQLAALNLKPGPNQIMFSASSRLQGVQTVACTLYLWEEDAKIIICDIDGTITRSDVLGQFLPILGKDWSHSGVAQLLSNISKNGYQVVYLTARAIGQSRSTRDYLHTLKQGENSLPRGPVIMTPDSLFQAFNREVIRRRPDEFKIEALADIRRLFPRNWNPFYAGFGNRQTDALSYRAVAIPLGKIFIVTRSGELKCFVTSFKSYSNINELVNELFPVIDWVGFVDEQYNEWNYWKAPIPDIDI